MNREKCITKQKKYNTFKKYPLLVVENIFIIKISNMIIFIWMNINFYFYWLQKTKNLRNNIKTVFYTF